jgi:chromosome partitioning protein
MATPTLVPLSTKAGAGTTTLVHHLAWMYAGLGLSVLVADLDPSASLTASLLEEDRLEELWSESDGRSRSIAGAIRPVLEGALDVAEPHVEPVADGLSLLAGDVALSGFEDDLGRAWLQCADGSASAFRVVTAIRRVLEAAARASRADIVLADVGPSLGAISRSAILAADHVMAPLSPDLFSLRGLGVLGPTLQRWRSQWETFASKSPEPLRAGLPSGGMRPLGYVVLRRPVRLDRPVEAHHLWMERIPRIYREAVLGEPPSGDVAMSRDPNLVGTLKHYGSLMSLAKDARRPMFLLRPADGALGAHQAAAGAAREEFEKLARSIAERIGVALP